MHDCICGIVTVYFVSLHRSISSAISDNFPFSLGILYLIYNQAIPYYTIWSFALRWYRIDNLRRLCRTDKEAHGSQSTENAGTRGSS